MSSRTVSTSLPPSMLRSLACLIHASTTGCVVCSQRFASSSEMVRMVPPFFLTTSGSSFAILSNGTAAMRAAASPEFLSRISFRSLGRPSYFGLFMTSSITDV
jgi:hypothetical protein